MWLCCVNAAAVEDIDGQAIFAGPTPQEGVGSMAFAYDLVVDKARRDCKLGLDTLPEEKPPALRIVRVRPGLVSEWNQSHPESPVKEFDTIIAVNGVQSGIQRMYEEIARSTKLTLRIMRH
mmetsp:Transcript_61018/g.175793  ORF Transcript_61018/g.175793 Transcript_61018/m.175793 type:complete len:121 (+) Transcript_61018:105-467(+)